MIFALDLALLMNVVVVCVQTVDTQGIEREFGVLLGVQVERFAMGAREGYAEINDREEANGESERVGKVSGA